MKICKIIIKDYQQFQDFELDLTYPEGHEKAGEPLEKVCLIGSNGTGKSTLLEIIQANLMYKNNSNNAPKSSITKYKLNDGNFYLTNNFIWFSEGIEETPNYKEVLNFSIDFRSLKQKSPAATKYIIPSEKIRSFITFKDNFNDLLIWSPSEIAYGTQIPNSNVNNALSLFKHFPYYHRIETNTLQHFWTLLIYLIKKRESDFLEFQKKEANLDKTVRKVQEEFDKKSPKILNKIAELWDKITLHDGF